MCSEDYQLHFTAPKGWKWDGEELVEDVPAYGSMHIGCYVPHHSASYSDFRERMAEEVKLMRRTYGRVRVRHFHVGSLEAVEVRSPYGKRPDSEYLQTFIDVPVYKKNPRVVHGHLCNDEPSRRAPPSLSGVPAVV